MMCASLSPSSQQNTEEAKGSRTDLPQLEFMRSRHRSKPKAFYPDAPGLAALFFLLVSLISPNSAQAQYRFDAWTTEHGLPQNSVLAIAQTPDGYLWLATFNGLVRFDGVRFTVFDKYNTPSMPSSRLADLYVDASGALWVVTAEDGVIRYQAGAFTPLTQAHGLPDNTVRQIQSGRAGELLFSTEKGLVWWRNGQFVADAEQRPFSTLKVYLGRSGTRWALSKDGLRARLADRVTHYALPVEPQDIFNARIYEDRSGSTWIALARQGVFKLKNGLVADYTRRLKLAPDVVIWKILEDQDGTFWFGTASSGLLHFKDVPEAEPVLYTTAHGLSSNAIRSLYQDREGTLWVGSGGGGLNGLVPQFISGYSTAQGLGGNIAHTVLADQAENLWVGTQAGLSKLSKGSITNYTAADGLPLGLQALHEDRAGRLWIGTSSGLYFFKDGIFSPVIPDLNVWARLEDRQGNLWVGTHFGLGKFKDGRFTNYTTAQGLYDNGVFQIPEDGRGNLWMSCYRGLYRVSKQQLNDYADGKISAIISTAFGKADGMLSSDCNGGRQPSGIKTRDGRLWFTTLKGVAVVNPEEMTVNPAPPPVLIESASLDRAVADIRDGSIEQPRIAGHCGGNRSAPRTAGKLVGIKGRNIPRGHDCRPPDRCGGGTCGQRL